MLKRGIKRKQPATDSPFWPDTQSLIKAGVVTPFVSNFVSCDIFGGDSGVVAETWAVDVESPLPPQDNRDLARVAQFYSVQENNREAKRHYLDSLKNYLFGLAQDDPDVDPDLLEEVTENYENKTFSEIAYQLGYPKFGNEQQNPLRLLAELPLPVYITTGYHDFLEVALTKVPKKPEVEIFYWDDSLHHIPSIFDRNPDFEPTDETPLVYHLYGLDQYPESLILTEDDYLDFLVKVSQQSFEVHQSEYRRGLPSSIRRALAGTALLLLGYGVYDWEFRVLFKGLIQAMNDSRNNRNTPESISVQISPDEGNSEAKIRAYLEEYFEQSSFKVYWGTPQQCMQDLWKLWER
jgi:hypothetical protein